MKIDGYELKDLKKSLITAKELSFEIRNDRLVFIITPEDGAIKTMVHLRIPKFTKEIA